MNIYDMFLESQNTLHAKGFCLNEHPAEQDATQYLLFCLADNSLTMAQPFYVSTKSYPVYGLLYVTEGTVSYRSDTDTPASIAVPMGYVYLFDCRISHTLFSQSQCSFSILYFDGYSAPYYCNKLLKEPLFQPLECNCEINFKVQNVLHLSNVETIHKHLRLTDLLTTLVCQQRPKTSRIPVYLSEIKHLLDTNYYTNHSLGELELAYKTDRYRICREFKLFFQISPIQYLHQVRMKNAQILLKEKDMKIHEIAYEVGYENVNHFIHHFKKTVGTTPAEYRKNLFH